MSKHTPKRIETSMATIRTDYIRSEANGYSSIAIHLEHGLKLPELAEESRAITAALRALAEKLEALPIAKDIE